VVTRWRSVPRLVFLDSCTMQWLHRYGGLIWEGESLAANDRLHNQDDGPAELDALCNVIAVGTRGATNFAISPASLAEIGRAGVPGYLQWAYDVASYWQEVVEAGDLDVSSPARREHAARLDGPTFGYLGSGDRALVRDAVEFGCDAFLTVEKRLAKNARHVESELGLRILRPTSLWALLQPWARLYL
jgi:hypothetical protein